MVLKSSDLTSEMAAGGFEGSAYVHASEKS
jgi:hypothetical protein